MSEKEKQEKEQPELVEQTIEQATEVEEGIGDFTPAPAKPLPKSTRTPKKAETERLKTEKAQAEDLDLEDKKRVLMNIPEATYQKIKDEAYERDTSRATIVREALTEYFANLENVEGNPDNTEIIGQIKKVIDESTDWFGNFNLEKFLANAQKKDLVGDEVWTPEVLEAYLVPKLRQASERLLSDDLHENTNTTIEALQLGEENAKFLAEKLGLELVEQGETEKPFEFM